MGVRRSEISSLIGRAKGSMRCVAGLDRLFTPKKFNCPLLLEFSVGFRGSCVAILRPSGTQASLKRILSEGAGNHSWHDSILGDPHWTAKMNLLISNSKKLWVTFLSRVRVSVSFSSSSSCFFCSCSSVRSTDHSHTCQKNGVKLVRISSILLGNRSLQLGTAGLKPFPFIPSSATCA